MRGDVIKSAGWVFELLELFDELERPVGLKEVASRLGYPESSAAALLRSLVTMGYLLHDRTTRTYAPTIRVARLGQWVAARLIGEERIDRLAARLADETGETILVGIQNDLWTHYVRAIEARRPLRYVVTPGTQRLMVRSGIGWSLLSLLGDDTVRSIARRSTALPEAEGLDIDPDALLALVRKVRRDGHVVSRHTVNQGVGVLAAPVPRTAVPVPLAIGIAGPVDRLEPRQAALLDTLHRAIDAVVPDRTEA